MLDLTTIGAAALGAVAGLVSSYVALRRDGREARQQALSEARETIDPARADRAAQDARPGARGRVEGARAGLAPARGTPRGAHLGPGARPLARAHGDDHGPVRERRRLPDLQPRRPPPRRPAAGGGRGRALRRLRLPRSGSRIFGARLMWTTGDIASCAPARLGVDEIARLTGRSRRGVEAAAHRQRISLRRPGERRGHPPRPGPRPAPRATCCRPRRPPTASSPRWSSPASRSTSAPSSAPPAACARCA